MWVESPCLLTNVFSHSSHLCRCTTASGASRGFEDVKSPESSLPILTENIAVEFASCWGVVVVLVVVAPNGFGSSKVVKLA